MKKINKFDGLVAAPFAPLKKDGSLNTELIPQYYDFLEKNRVKGVFINGTTGEGVSLTQKKKMILTEKWTTCFAKKKSIRIINLVGGTSYEECIENAIYSKECGVSAIAIVPPFYFKPSDPTLLADYCARIGESVPDLPIYLYHIPFLTGVYTPMINFLEKISAMLPNFAGIKFTHEDFMDYLSCLNYDGGKFDLLWGRDECMLSALVVGSKGAVGSTFNYAAPLYHKLIGAFNKGDLVEARQLQQKSIDMISLLGKYGGIATGKAYMRYVGIDCGNFRLPVKNMPEDLYNSFVRDVQKLDMDGLFSIL